MVDADGGTASNAVAAMQSGFDSVLMNTAIADARDPLLIAHAIELVVQGWTCTFQCGADSTKSLRIGIKPYPRQHWLRR